MILLENKKSKTKKKTNTNKVNNKTKKTNKKNKNIKLKILKIFLFSCIAIGIIGIGMLVGVMAGVVNDTELKDVSSFDSSSYTTFFYDINGNPIDSVYEENRVSVKYSDLPKHMVDAVTSIEDERFFKHKGVDIKRTASAILSHLASGGNSSYGGSTITQQLVKQVYGDKDRTVTRKIKEWYRAYILETKLDKTQILESYLNIIYYGDGAYGIEIAAQNFFGKSVRDVDIAEAACLAAMIQSPEGTNAYGGDAKRERLLKRQKIVLSKMLELGKITKEQYDEAVNKELEFKKGKIVEDKVKSYFIEMVINKCIDTLQKEKGMTEAQARNKIYNGGYKIYTTFDPRVQGVLDEVFSDPNLFAVSRKYGVAPQAGMVVMDQKNGYVLGVAGGYTGSKTGDFQLNRAIIPRQPGSSIKPISTYGPGFEKGVISPGSTIVDEPINIGGWKPKNSDNRFHGPVTVRKAVAMSYNIPAVKTLQKVGIDYSYKFLTDLGISTLVPTGKVNDKNLPALALGGLTYGITPYDLTGAYSAIANGGIYTEPIMFTKITDKNDKEVYVTKRKIKRVMSEQTAYLLTDVLRSVVTSGTGTAGNLGKMPAACKTGMTNDDKDRWFAGFTPYYTAACWYGYDKKMVIDKRGPYPPVILWKNVMKKLTEGMPVKQFDSPTGVVKGTVCRVSGMLPTEACGGDVITEMFSANTLPTETCNVHKFVEVCGETGKLPTQYCPFTKKVSVTDDNKITEYCDKHKNPPVVEVPTENEDKDKNPDKDKENDQDKKPGDSENKNPDKEHNHN